METPQLISRCLSTLRRALDSALSPPDAELTEVSRAAERLLARVRLIVLTTFVAPAAYFTITDPNTLGPRLCLWAASSALVVSVLLFREAHAQPPSPRLPFVALSFEIFAIHVALAMTAWLVSPVAATNNLVLFGVLLISLCSASLRLDPRVPVVGGLLATLLYGGLLLTVASPQLPPAEMIPAASHFGSFNWNPQLARLALIQVASGIAVVMTLQTGRLATLSVVDDLTGLLNRRFFDQALRSAMDNAAVSGSPVMLGIVDIDHFKQVNDTYGHQVGDQVLRFVAATLKRHFRTVDLVARHGGEEFAVIVNRGDIDVALRRLDQFRRELPLRPIPVIMGTDGQRAELPPVQVSIGAAVGPRDHTRATPLMAIADARLYQAKAAGRDRMIGPEECEAEPLLDPVGSPQRAV